MKRSWKELKEIDTPKSSSSIDICSSNEPEMQNRLNSLKEKKVQLNSLSSPDSDSSIDDSIGNQKEDANSLKLNEAGNPSSASSTIKQNTLLINSNGKEIATCVQSSVPSCRGRRKSKLDSSYSNSEKEGGEEDCELISHKVLFSYKSVFIKSIVDITEEDKVWIDTIYHVESCCEKTEVER